jgi:4'-phosphopantetheinyl transferase EntD
MISLFPPRIHTLFSTEEPDLELLYPEEKDRIANAVEKRRREYAMGRLCARRALAHFGVTGFPLVAGSDRAPIWPEHLVGSVSHCTDLCAVAVALKKRFAGIGLDVEFAKPLERGLFRLVLTDREMSALSRYADREARLRAKVIFSAKESVFKCLYPLIRRFIDFRECNVALLEGGVFTASVRPEVPEVEPLRGRFFVEGVHIITGTTIVASAATDVESFHA